MITKVISVINDPSKILKLQVIKFIKSVLINDDENLNKLICNNDCLLPIIELFNKNSKKDNLLVSAILDLFEFINKNHIKKIILYLFEKYNSFFYCEENRGLFNSLITKYEQSLEQFDKFGAIKK